VKSLTSPSSRLQGSGRRAVGVEHFLGALRAVRPSCLRGSLGRTELSPASWEQIGGLDEVKLRLRQVAERRPHAEDEP